MNMPALGTSNEVLKLLVTALISVVLALVGAYAVVSNQSVSRAEMQQYVQNNSPFAHEQALFVHTEDTVNRLENLAEALQLKHQRLQDQIELLQHDIRQLQRGEILRG